MTRSIRVVAAGLLLSTAPPLLHAEDGKARDRSSFSMYVDQDVFFPPAFDQDFTMGALFEWQGGWVDRSWLRDPLRGIDKVFGLHGAHCRKEARQEGAPVYAFGFGDSAFTPRKERLGSTDPVPYDRPYANLFFATVRRTTPATRTALTTELTLGILGLGLGRDAQTWIHKNVSDDVRPGGWSHQISHGGEMTARYRVGFKRRLLTPRAWPWGKSGGSRPARLFDATGSLDASVGYYTNVGAGLRLRVGFIDSPWWGGERLPNSNVFAIESGRETFELYAVGGVGGTLWGYNALMQGQFRESDVRLGFGDADPGEVRLERAVVDLQAGIAGRWKGFSLAYLVTFHSPLFEGVTPEGADAGRWHNWGGVYLTWARWP